MPSRAAVRDFPRRTHGLAPLCFIQQEDNDHHQGKSHTDNNDLQQGQLYRPKVIRGGWHEIEGETINLSAEDTLRNTGDNRAQPMVAIIGAR